MSDTHDSGPDTNPGGRVTNEDLLYEFREREDKRDLDERAWRANHDKEANDRNAALMSAILGDRTMVRGLDQRVRSLETLGIPQSARKFAVIAVILLSLAVTALYLDLGLRWVLANRAPFVRAVVIP
jgi:hypothetical protein